LHNGLFARNIEFVQRLTDLGTKFSSVVAIAGSAATMGATSIGWQTSGGNTFIYVKMGIPFTDLAEAVTVRGCQPIDIRFEG
jgi:hypothetical protein